MWVGLIPPCGGPCGAPCGAPCGVYNGGGGLMLAAALDGGGGVRFKLAIPLVTEACVCVGMYVFSKATW